MANVANWRFLSFLAQPSVLSRHRHDTGMDVLTAAPLAILVGFAAIIVLAAAPFSEEPWLRSQYGSDFDKYAEHVRRFL